MTWVKWWAFEIISGASIVVVARPLSLGRYMTTIVLTMFFAVFYRLRTNAQLKRQAQSGS